MSRVIRRQRRSGAWVARGQPAATPPETPDVTTITAPGGTPVSTVFTVSVDGDATAVYSTAEGHFANFISTPGTVTVTVTRSTAFTTAEVRPRRFGITPTFTPGGTTLSFPVDVDLTQVYVAPSKIAGLTVITRELSDDSTPEAANVVGQALSRDIARRVDEAFFGSPAGTVAPDGLPDLTGVQTVEVTGGYTSLDPFAAAVSKAETLGARTTALSRTPDCAGARADQGSDPERQAAARSRRHPSWRASPARRAVVGVPLRRGQRRVGGPRRPGLRSAA